MATEKESLTRQLENLKRNLQILQEQKAVFGPLDVPANKIIQIEDLQKEIEKVEQELTVLEPQDNNSQTELLNRNILNQPIAKPTKIVEYKFFGKLTCLTVVTTTAMIFILSIQVLLLTNQHSNPTPIGACKSAFYAFNVYNPDVPDVPDGGSSIIRGVVLNNAKEPIVGAVIRLISGVYSFTTTTNSSGNYQIGGLGRGTWYVVVLSAPYYTICTSFSATVNLSGEPTFIGVVDFVESKP